MTDDKVIRALRDVSAWDSDEGVWERAVEIATARPAGVIGREEVTPSRLWWWNRYTGIAACLLIGVCLGAFMLPNLGHDRYGDVAVGEMADSFDDGVVVEGKVSGLPLLHVDAFTTRGEAAGGEAQAVSGRKVVRRATIELRLPDVRAGYLKARQLLRPELGEFIDGSELKDNRGRLMGDLTLRVDASRLDEVLGGLRELGEVVTDKADAEDVTAQVVDTEARIRNEQRVEQELLKLLDERTDADLDDVLSVRRELSAVRERIERMVAQRDRLSGLVRLATVVVILRQSDAEPEPEPTLGDWFKQQMSDAWHDGLASMLGGVAWMVRVAVGGAIWIVGLIVVGGLVWKGWRKHHPRALPE